MNALQILIVTYPPVLRGIYVALKLFQEAEATDSLENFESVAYAFHEILYTAEK
jgi:hypothetical protein